jgi:hypothetical protein
MRPMKTKKNHILLSLFIILILVACSSPTGVVTQPQNPNAQQTLVYPAPLGENTSAYPYPQPGTTGTNNAGPTYTPDPLLGAVTGKLMVNNQGVNNATLYLAAIMKDKSGKDVIAGLDRANSPSADTNHDGIFSFINIAPGRYALILDAVITQYMMNSPGKGTAIIFEIVAGKLVDLGDLNYDSLPLPNSY